MSEGFETVIIEVMKTLTIEELPEDIVDLAITPQGMARARAAILAAFSEEAERIAALRRGTEQADAGETLSYEDALASSLALFQKRVREQNTSA